MNTNPQKSQDLIREKRGVISRFFRMFSVKEKTETLALLYNEETGDLLESIKNAKNEWICANVNFEYAEDQETVDYYTYKIKACQVRYEYLLKKAKEKGLRVDISENSNEFIRGTEVST